MAAEPPKTTSSADSYIGSLISLTSKSEIRYEGILYSINTEESSIGLRNVRSFGTEGRKKDGPQVAPSDKVYEYILFRGTDIKDLQVKSSPAAQPAAPSSSIDNDPAIIQSHYPRPAPTPTNLVPAAVVSSADANTHVPQLGHPGSSFPGALPLYQPGGNLGSWGPSPPPGANGSGLAMPMYWPGFFGPPNGLSQLPQQNLLRPTFGLSVPSSLQQSMQYPGFSPAMSAGATSLAGSKLPEIPPSLVSSSSSSAAVSSMSLQYPGFSPAMSAGSTSLPGSKLPEIPPSLVTSSSGSAAVSSMSLPQLNLPPVPSSSLASEQLSNSAVPKVPTSTSGLLSTPLFPSLSSLGVSAPDSGIITSAAPNKINAVASLSYPGLTMSQAASSIINVPAASLAELPTPSLVTPDQLLQTGQVPISSSPSSQVAHNVVEVVQVSSALSESKSDVAKEAQPPILPLPPSSRAFNKPNGTPYQPRQSYNYRGRGRGSGSSHGRGITKFTEDFDFMAMNEKFKKDEVWGHLGKSNKSHPNAEGNSAVNGGDSSEDEDEEEPIETKPVYNKDDFFDTLSCNTLEHYSQNGRTKFSEQLKIDAETFGEFARYRGGRGGRGPGRGWRGRGGYYGRGYGYSGSGRGRGMSTRA